MSAEQQTTAEAHTDRIYQQARVDYEKELPNRVADARLLGFRAGLERAAQECDEQADEYDTAVRTAYSIESALQAESCHAACDMLAAKFRALAQEKSTEKESSK